MADKIITISGKQFCGKDTVAGILLENLPEFGRIGLGDAIKREYSRRIGIAVEEIEKNKSFHREGLIKLGNEGRAISDDYWLKAVINTPGNIIVPDVRMPFEAKTFKEAGAFMIRVEASAQVRGKRAPLTNSNDYTETALDDFDGWNFIVKNEGTLEDLKEQCKQLVEMITKFK